MLRTLRCVCISLLLFRSLANRVWRWGRPVRAAAAPAYIRGTLPSVTRGATAGVCLRGAPFLAISTAFSAVVRKSVVEASSSSSLSDLLPRILLRPPRRSFGGFFFFFFCCCFVYLEGASPPPSFWKDGHARSFALFGPRTPPCTGVVSTCFE